ncbi:MAG TPA: hypothetical protein VHO94_04280 [Oscillospiraceae bacterium]|nr:hypothetical protein [Oscillospiraceae bacterium]
MPKLRRPADEIQNRTIIASIKYGMEMQNVTTDDLALAMRTSTVTVYARFKDPGTFRLEELRAVSRKIRIPLEKLMGCDVS